jgi:hypothetical protein
VNVTAGVTGEGDSEGDSRSDTEAESEHFQVKKSNFDQGKSRGHYFSRLLKITAVTLAWLFYLFYFTKPLYLLSPLLDIFFLFYQKKMFTTICRVI